MTGPIFWNLGELSVNSDVIVVAKLDAAPAPYEVLGRRFYKIQVQTPLKGEIELDRLLVVVTDVDSTEGAPPSIEPNTDYVLFLSKAQSETPGGARRVEYHLVGNWKGILSLDKKAFEARSVQAIQKQFAIDVIANRSDFIAAIKHHVGSEKDEAISEMASLILQSLTHRKNVGK